MRISSPPCEAADPCFRVRTASQRLWLEVYPPRFVTFSRFPLALSGQAGTNRPHRPPRVKTDASPTEKFPAPQKISSPSKLKHLAACAGSWFYAGNSWDAGTPLTEGEFDAYRAGRAVDGGDSAQAVRWNRTCGVVAD